MKYLLITLLLASASPSHAEFIDGNDLYNSIKSEKQYEQALATGYIVGVHDVLVKKLFCTPSDITASKLVEVVKVELEIFTHQRKLSADSFVASALKRTWPCAPVTKLKNLL